MMTESDLVSTATNQDNVLRKRMLRELRHQKGKVPQDLIDKLMNIFSEVSEDPEWHEDSYIYNLYQDRVPIQELLSLFTCDKEYSYVASKK